MELSSILVVVTQPQFDATVAVLTAMKGLQVHYSDQVSSRIIVTQETQNTDEQIQGLQHIKLLPHVVMAEMVYHYCEDTSD